MSNFLLAEMLTRIRNAILVKHINTNINYNKLNLSILKILKKEKYIKNYNIINNKNKKIIIVYLKYLGWWIKKPLFRQIKFINSLKNDNYFKSNINKNIYLKNNLYIVSTSFGVMTYSKAFSLKIGGKLLCYFE